MLNVLLKGSDPTGPREGLRPQGESRVMLGAHVAPAGCGGGCQPFLLMTLWLMVVSLKTGLPLKILP